MKMFKYFFVEDDISHLQLFTEKFLLKTFSDMKLIYLKIEKRSFILVYKVDRCNERGK